MNPITNTNIQKPVTKPDLLENSSISKDFIMYLPNGLYLSSAKEDARGLYFYNLPILKQAPPEHSYQTTATVRARVNPYLKTPARSPNSPTELQALLRDVKSLYREVKPNNKPAQFNDTNILDGSFLSKYFESSAKINRVLVKIGTEVNPAAKVRVGDAPATALGSNELASNNTHGITAATNMPAQVGATGTSNVPLYDIRRDLQKSKVNIESLIEDSSNALRSNSPK